MIDVRVITSQNPHLDLPRGVRWLYIARATRSFHLRTSQGGTILAAFARNGRGDIMVPEEFTALYFEFQLRDFDTGNEGSATVYYSDSPIRATIIGDVYYEPNSEVMHEPFMAITTEPSEPFVTGSIPFVTAQVDGNVHQSAAGIGGENATVFMVPTVSSPRRSRSYFFHSSQGAFPWGMLYTAAAAQRIPVVEFSFVTPATPFEVFFHELNVEYWAVSAATTMAIDVMYEPAGYALVGGAAASVVETDDLPLFRGFNPLSLSAFRRSTNAGSTCPDDATKLIARRIIEVPLAGQGRVNLLDAMRDTPGRQSPVQPVLLANGVTGQGKILVVIQVSGALNFRELVTARFSVSDRADEGGDIWT